MAQDAFRDFQDERAVRQAEAEAPEAETENPSVISPAAASSLLSGPMAGVQRRAIVQNVGQHLGNRQVQRMLGEMRRSASSGPEGGNLEGDLSERIQSERSNGQPMDTSLRGQVERAVGHDLSQVRVHTGSAADELNRSVGAKAFTTGRDIFYRGDQSPTDLELTTHEATHTVQQGFSETPPATIGAADTAHEQAADHTAAHAGAGGVQREEEDELAMKRDGLQREEEDELAMKRDTSLQREEEDELAMKRDASLQREGDEDELAMKRDDSIQREEEDELAMKRDSALQREEEDELAMKRDDPLQREEEEENLAMKRDASLQREGDEEEVMA